MNTPTTGPKIEKGLQMADHDEDDDDKIAVRMSDASAGIAVGCAKAAENLGCALVIIVFLLILGADEVIKIIEAIKK